MLYRPLTRVRCVGNDVPNPTLPPARCADMINQVQQQSPENKLVKFMAGLKLAI